MRSQVDVASNSRGLPQLIGIVCPLPKLCGFGVLDLILAID